MKIIYATTWPFESGLSKSTVHPHIVKLASYNEVEKIFYISTESAYLNLKMNMSDKIHHIPVNSCESKLRIVDNVFNQIRLTRKLRDIARCERPDLTICRGTPAGIYGYRLKKSHGIPFVVESYEPHAQYMKHSGVWKPYDPKYVVQRIWERSIKRSADKLVTVSHRYRKHLEYAERIEPGRLGTVPCWVNTDIFKFDPNERIEIRRKLRIQDRLVCVYVGKFGGMYYRERAFAAMEVIRQAASRPVYFLILSPDDREPILKALSENGVPGADIHVEFTDFVDVFKYLSAADFAISIHKSSPVSYAFSPIKHGEYWACGLPVIIPSGVGDEAAWIDSSDAGSTADFEEYKSIAASVMKIEKIVAEVGHRGRIRDIALKKRNNSSLSTLYDCLVNRYSKTNQ